MGIPKAHLWFIMTISVISIFVIYQLQMKLTGEGEIIPGNRLEKEIVILTKPHLKNIIVKVDIGGVNKEDKIIRIVATSRKSPYSKGLEYRIAVKVLHYLSERTTPFEVEGVSTSIFRGDGFSYDRIAFVSTNEFIEQMDMNKNIKDPDSLIEEISKNLENKRQ